MEKRIDLLARNKSKESWLSLIAQIPKERVDLHQKILTLASETIIPSLDPPFLLLDYLTQMFSHGGLLGLLSLKGLFTLISKHNLDYPNFYHQLYSLLDDTALLAESSESNGEVRKHLFESLDLFLSSTHLPGYYVAAFVKKLARLALNGAAPTTATLWIIPFIYNLTKKHPVCLQMLHRPQSAFQANEQQKEEAFDPKAPLESAKALSTSLWEIAALEGHWMHKVALKSKILVQKCNKAPFNLEDYSAQSFASLMAHEQQQRATPKQAVYLDCEARNIF
jgi:U3 small nucleolar RNA-associated protein 19